MALAGAPTPGEPWNLTTAGAVTQCQRGMGTPHRTQAHSIQIMKVEETVASKCCQQAVKQFHDSEINFWLPHRVPPCHHKPHFPTKRSNAVFQMQSLLVPRRRLCTVQE
uniref:Large ribosomal subunit protein eL20 n=1 Tax=Felis catus TaxID=9685 RepID=A0ABI7ZP40_FELCA